MPSSVDMNGMPFDAKQVDGEWDRSFYSSDIARYLGSAFSDGILVDFSKGQTLTSQLKVTNLNTQVTVSAGTIVVGGKIGWLLNSQTLDIAPNTLALERVDLVVVEKSDVEQDRKFSVKIVQGTPGEGVPELTRDDYVWQMCLAQVGLLASSPTIAVVNDTRSSEALCGISKLVVGPKSISGIDEIRLVSTEPTDIASQSEPRVLFIWGES